MNRGTDGKRPGRQGRGASLFNGWSAPAEGIVLPREFYARPAAAVARALLGTIVISTVDGIRCSGRIVEVEAYTGPEDEASHASARIGRTNRNLAMFGDPGSAYVYRIYGIHWCLNAVTDAPGHPAAVLIRAAEPLEGLEIAATRRGVSTVRDLMRGPGNLCRALGITGALNGHPMDRAPLRLLAGEPVGEQAVRCGPRIGITRATDLPLRFWIANDPFVSGRNGAPAPAARSAAYPRHSQHSPE